MIFRPFYYFDTGCAAYLFGCGTLGKCAVVDPQSRDVAAYLEFAAAKGMRITHVIDTHVHADHRSGGLSWHAEPARITVCTRPPTSRCHSRRSVTPPRSSSAIRA